MLYSMRRPLACCFDRLCTMPLILILFCCTSCGRSADEEKAPAAAKTSAGATASAEQAPPAGENSCTADPNWLDQSAPLPLFNAPAPPRHPAPDCPFYQAAWQVFLYATRPVELPDGTSVPRFLASPEFFTIEQAFGAENIRDFAPKTDEVVLSLAVRSLQRSNSSTPENDGQIAAGVTQAGSLSPCIDQNGNPLYYAIHFNDVMKKFFDQPDPAKPAVTLSTVDGLKQAQTDPGFATLEFPAGSIELKSAWQIVDESNPPAGYFVVKAGVPVLTTRTDAVTNETSVVVDTTKPPLTRSVALIALHVVFTLKDHPEFVWSTFEHVDRDGNPDTAPSAAHNPVLPPGPTEFVASPVTSFLLFKTGTQFADANKLVTSADIVTHFDETAQSFTKTGTPFQTSIYRVYRASIADDMKGIDDDVEGVNESMASIFRDPALNLGADARTFFRLVGAVWMDDPRGVGNPAKAFKPGLLIRNAAGQSPDDLNAIVAGEDRLSGTALESFTQFDPTLAPTHRGNPNCFFCHDSKAILDGPDAAHIGKSQLNVSHILSRYLGNAVSPAPVPPQ